MRQGISVILMAGLLVCACKVTASPKQNLEKPERAEAVHRGSFKIGEEFKIKDIIGREMTVSTIDHLLRLNREQATQPIRRLTPCSSRMAWALL